MSGEGTELVVTPISEIKAVVDTLAGLGIDPLHLHIDGQRPTDHRPNITVWVRYRTEFEATCGAFNAKAVERRFIQHGQREWYAESDTATRRLLIQCVSFEHHADWAPRQVSA